MTHEYRRNQMLMAAIKVKMVLGFSHSLKKFRGYKCKQICKMRGMFSFYALLMNGNGKGNAYEEAKAIVKQALRSQELYKKFKVKMRKMF